MESDFPQCNEGKLYRTMVGRNNIGRPSIQPNLHYHSGLATQGDLIKVS